MNRQIKFRAWDSRNRKMDICDSLDERFPDFAVNFQDAQYVVMQFTGQMDKNGKEIYEGDVCKAPHDFGPGGFSERQFTVGWHNERGYQWNYWDLTQIEVIGNIYENPELLNQ